MIAAATVPWLSATPERPATWDGFLIVEEVSGALFNPTSGAWEPFTDPLQPPDLKRLIVLPGGPMRFASITAWPFAGWARLWANLGDAAPGIQVVAMRLNLDPRTGEFARDPGTPPIRMGLSPALPVAGRKPLPGVSTTRPIVPGRRPATT